MTAPRMLPTALVAALALAAPAGAHAATLTADGGHYTFTGGPEDTHLDVQGVDGTDQVVFYANVAMAEPLPAGCTPSDLYGDEVVTCPAPTRVDAFGGDGKDRLVIDLGAPAGIPIAFDGGAGDDDLEGDARNDELHGGPGNDQLPGGDGNDLLDGGDGNDTIDGAAGADHLLGGAGDDVLTPDHFEDPSADVVDGGPGVDTIENDWKSRFSSGPPQRVTLTVGGGADDGRPGEGDDVQGVERFTLPTAVHFVGTDAPEYVKEHQVGDAGELDGNGGNDELRGGDGADKIDGGAGDDIIDGGYGDDTIVGGPGKDRISGDLLTGDCGPLWCKYPYGNDTIDVRDGEVDSVTCGAGQDTVKADANDVIAPDCETVDRGAAPGTGPGTGTGAGGGGSAGGSAPTGATLRLAGSIRLAKALRTGFTVRVSGVPAGTLKLVAKRGKVVVARGTAKVGASGTAKVRLTFTKAARRALRAKRTVALRVTGGGAAATIALRR